MSISKKSKSAVENEVLFQKQQRTAAELFFLP